MKKDSKIKNIILINDFDYTQGGASKVAVETANLLVKEFKDINVYFFSAVHSKESTLNEKIIRVCTNQKEALKDKNKIRGAINGIYNFKAKNELRKLLNSLDRNSTIIHVHGWTKCLSSSVFDVIFKKKFKVVLTMHDYFTACPNGGYFNYKKNNICHFKPLSKKCIKCNCDSRSYLFKLYRVLRQYVQTKVVKLTDRLTDVISISDFSENILKSTLGKNTKIHRVYNPIDCDTKIKNVDFKNNKYFLSVGRLSPEKGVNIFCEAITKANLEGIVVGDGSEKSELEKMYPNIKFVGWKNSEEVRDYMKNAKALVFTSKLYEGSPLTTMEALIMGLPCFVSDCCAAVDQINEGVNGCSFSDSDDLAKKLNYNFDNFSFNYDHIYIEELIECYEDVL